MKFKELWVHKFGISGAGPVPNSLLARQDLEGEERDKSIASDDSLRDLADDAAEAGTKKEKKGVKTEIIDTQKERQLETLRLRGKLNKSMSNTFKNFWKGKYNLPDPKDMALLAWAIKCIKQGMNEVNTIESTADKFGCGRFEASRIYRLARKTF